MKKPFTPPTEDLSNTSRGLRATLINKKTFAFDNEEDIDIYLKLNGVEANALSMCDCLHQTMCKADIMRKHAVSLDHGLMHISFDACIKVWYRRETRQAVSYTLPCIINEPGIHAPKPDADRVKLRKCVDPKDSLAHPSPLTYTLINTLKFLFHPKSPEFLEMEGAQDRYLLDLLRLRFFRRFGLAVEHYPVSDELDLVFIRHIKAEPLGSVDSNI